MVQAVGRTDLFKKDTSKKLDKHPFKIFHQAVAKALFLCKQARPGIQTIVAILCRSVYAPGRSDWKKLVRMVQFLYTMSQDWLILSAGNGLWELE